MKTKEVEVIDLQTELQVFDPIHAKIEEMKEKNASIVFDYEDKQGNKDARSHIARLRKLKKPVTEIHKMAKAEALRFTKALDGKKKQLIGAVDDMIKVHHEPIWEIEQRELAIQAEKELEAKRQEEEAEAARLAEIEAKEKELAEKESELAAKQRRIDQHEHEREIAENAARKAEAEAKQAGIDAENRRVADVQRAKDEAAAEAARVKRLAEEEQRVKDEEVLAAKHAELARIEQEKAAEEARISDEKHRSKIHRAIYKALRVQLEWQAASEKGPSQVVTQALIDNKIPHVTINY